MKTPFDFDTPEASSGGGKLEAGRYNVTALRVAGLDDRADENGIVEGKNGWKALKLIFAVDNTGITLDATFTTDYDRTIEDGDKRAYLLDYGKSSYRALASAADADLADTDDLMGKTVSVLCNHDDAGYLKIDAGRKGENWDRKSRDAKNIDSDEDEEREAIQSEDSEGIDDDNIPF